MKSIDVSLFKKRVREYQKRKYAGKKINKKLHNSSAQIQ